MYQPPLPPLPGDRSGAFGRPIAGVGQNAPDRPRWMRKLAPIGVGLTWTWLIVFWVGLLILSQDPVALTWLAAFWAIDVVVLPCGVLGTVWAGMLRERGMMWGGIVGTLLLVPGFFLGLVTVAMWVYALVR